MDSQEKDPARLSLPMNRWLSTQRDDSVPIAWRGDQLFCLGQFRRDVAALAAILVSREEHRWALCFDDSYRFAVALLASLYAGRLPVIFGHQREAILKEQRADYDALLTDLPLDPGVPVLAVREGGCEDIALPAWPQDPRFILYTSGSTGQPQAVCKSVACMDRESELLAAAFSDVLRGCWVVASVSHQHMYGLSFRLFLPLALGLPFDAQLTQYQEQLIARHQGRRLVFVSSPAWLKRLDNRLTLAECVEVFSAGGPLSEVEAQLARQMLGVLPLEIYGTTETGSLAWRRQNRDIALWQPFTCVRLRVDSDNRIEVMSPLIPDTGKTLLSDIIELAPDGRQFQLNGRADRIIKLEEKRLSLTEVERRLVALPEVADAAVLTQQQRGRTLLVAVVVLSPYGQLRRQTLSEGAFTRELHQALRGWLEPVALPRSWRIIDAIPLNPQGKRAYAELQELFL
ncbi:MAG: AMP-binding protein [Serratia liquefaciens]|jgi:acyl-coenzyme A synthetase/AMP-(fatty) acid ligase|nr:AMP-binding protein [Serratia liquefaciens]MCH4234721.1 AMP-binding protein [Serratia liquefaciens]MCH4260827.1 AMP-binding protein [Serratia liquefaciens]MCI1212403.1 AMP-binding protein [Serratia liquefaciens]MCI1233268.1 AMP-binding protein [Serratia liquefaciens]